MRFGFREIILFLILLAVPVSSYWLVFRPQNAEIQRAKEEIAHKRSVLTKLREETAKSADLLRANDEIAASIRAIEARLPTNKEVDTIVRQVSSLALEVGLDSPQMKSAKPFKSVLYMEQPLEMTINGDFLGFYGFLLKLEQLPRVTRITSMKLSRAADKGAPKVRDDDKKPQGQMKAEFTLTIYFQDDQSSHFTGTGGSR